MIRDKGLMQETIIHTGQHFDQNMSDIFFSQMDIPLPAYNLEVNNMRHGAMTGRMLEEIEKVLLYEKPDLVMVYGDTNSTLAGALAAKKLDLVLAHVEAGLRSFNMAMPEEINRVLTDRISDLLFCPTENAVYNLKQEGFRNFKAEVKLVGDVMYDAALYYGENADSFSHILEKRKLVRDGFFLCSLHRQENTDNMSNLRSIVTALNEINRILPVILPLHPRTRKILQEQRIDLEFQPLDPVGYFDMLKLIKNCKLVITDSGGMQKEAYFFSKYCITLRKETEWVELTQHKVNFLAGASSQKILRILKQVMNLDFPPVESLYGNGNAGETIHDIIFNH
jgi:UDP-GlcNAc3NAcA epimerase